MPILSLGWSYTCPPKSMLELASCIYCYCLRAREVHQASLETSPAFALGYGPPNIPLLLTSPVGHSPGLQEGCWGRPSPRHICTTGCVARLHPAGAWRQVPSICTPKGQAGSYVSGAGHSGMEEQLCRSSCGLPMPRGSACTEGSRVMSRAGSPGVPLHGRLAQLALCWCCSAACLSGCWSPALLKCRSWIGSELLWMWMEWNSSYTGTENKKPYNS